MDRKRAAGALLALAAYIACTAAAPTSSNHTALDLYDAGSEGCYYNFQHYGEADRIMTNEPCLNCTCHNRMLMCYLRVCPFTKPIGQDCTVEKRADQCCPIVTCPDVPVDLLTSTSTTSPSEYGATGVGKLDKYGCSINNKYFPEGAKVPPSPNKPCEHCYCIRNMTTCVMQECTLHVDGCTPIYHKDVCCPVRYSCDHPEDEIPLLDDLTTTVRPTPGFLLTTTTVSSVTQMSQDCVHDDQIFADGALIKTEKACEHCYCMKGDIVCVVQECGTPMENEGKNCTSMPPREGQCCPDTYICEGDEPLTEAPTSSHNTSEDTVTTESIYIETTEGNGYRLETSDDDFNKIKPTEVATATDKISEDKLLTTETSEVTESSEKLDERFGDSDQQTNMDKSTQSQVIENEFTTAEPDKDLNTVPNEPLEGDYNKNIIKPTEKIESEAFTTQKDSEELPTTASGYTYPTPSKTEFEEERPVMTTESPFRKEDEIKETATTQKNKIEVKETTLGPLSNEATEIENSTSDFVATISPLPVSEVTTKTESSSDLPMTEQVSEFTTTSLLHHDKNTESSTSQTEYIEKLTTEPEKATTQRATTEKYTTDRLADERPTTEKDTAEKDTAEKDTTEGATTYENQEKLTTELYKVPEISTVANAVDNEIEESTTPVSLPGRIPGEGDCLLNGIRYNNESEVVSSNKCQINCKCISSIIKCDPITCSPPPEYIENCQAVYDSPDSCCPTYMCDHSKETIPPQSHNQMSGTDAPITECKDNNCAAHDDNAVVPELSCGPDGCQTESVTCDTANCKTNITFPIEQAVSTSSDCMGGKCDQPEANVDKCHGEKCNTAGETLDCDGNDCHKQQDQEPIEQAVSTSSDCVEGKCDQPEANVDKCHGEKCNTAGEKLDCDGNDCHKQPDQEPTEQAVSTSSDCMGGKCDQPEANVDKCHGEKCNTAGEKLDCDGNDCHKQPDQEPTELCNGQSCEQPATPSCDGKPCENPIQSNPPTDTSDIICTEEGCRKKIVNNINETPICSTPDCIKNTLPTTDHVLDDKTPENEVVTEQANAATTYSENEQENTNKPTEEQTTLNVISNEQVTGVSITENNTPEITTVFSKIEKTTVIPDIITSQSSDSENTMDVMTTILPGLNNVEEYSTESLNVPSAIPDDTSSMEDLVTKPTVMETENQPLKPEISEEGKISTLSPEINTEFIDLMTTPSIVNKETPDTQETTKYNNEISITTNEPIEEQFELTTNVPTPSDKIETSKPEYIVTNPVIYETTTKLAEKENEIYKDTTTTLPLQESEVTTQSIQSYTENKEPQQEISLSSMTTIAETISERSTLAPEVMEDLSKTTSSPYVTEQSQTDFLSPVTENEGNKPSIDTQGPETEIENNMPITDKPISQNSDKPLDESETVIFDSTTTPKIEQQNNGVFETENEKLPNEPSEVVDEKTASPAESIVTATQPTQDILNKDLTSATTPNKEASSDEMTTPYFIELEEHTHKTYDEYTEMSLQDVSTQKSEYDHQTEKAEPEEFTEKATAASPQNEILSQIDMKNKTVETTTLPREEQPIVIAVPLETEKPLVPITEKEEIYTNAPSISVTEPSIGLQSTSEYVTSRIDLSSTDPLVTSTLPSVQEEASQVTESKPSAMEETDKLESEKDEPSIAPTESATLIPNDISTDNLSVTDKILISESPSTSESAIKENESAVTESVVLTTEKKQYEPENLATETTAFESTPQISVQEPSSTQTVIKATEVAISENSSDIPNVEEVSSDNVVTASPPIEPIVTETVTYSKEVASSTETTVFISETIPITDPSVSETISPYHTQKEEPTTEKVQPQETTDKLQTVSEQEQFVEKEQTTTDRAQATDTDHHVNEIDQFTTPKDIPVTVKDTQNTEKEKSATENDKLATEKLATEKQELATETPSLSMVETVTKLTELTSELPLITDSKQIVTQAVPMTTEQSSLETEEEKYSSGTEIASDVTKDSPVMHDDTPLYTTQAVSLTEAPITDKVSLENEKSPFSTETILSATETNLIVTEMESLPTENNLIEAGSTTPESVPPKLEIDTSTENEPKPPTDNKYLPVDSENTMPTTVQTVSESSTLVPVVVPLIPESLSTVHDFENAKTTTSEPFRTEDQSSAITNTVTEKEDLFTPEIDSASHVSEIAPTTNAPSYSASETKTTEYTPTATEVVETASESSPLDTETSTSLIPQPTIGHIPLETISSSSESEEPLVTEMNVSTTESPMLTVSSTQEVPTVNQVDEIATENISSSTESESPLTSSAETSESTQGIMKVTNSDLELTTKAVSLVPEVTETVSKLTEDLAEHSEPVAIVTEAEHAVTESVPATTVPTSFNTESAPEQIDMFSKPESKPTQSTSTPEEQKPDFNEVSPTDENVNEENQSGSSGYGQEPDYDGEEDQAFGPGTCRYGGKVYVSAQQIPRDDPCDFCFCFRSDIICLQQSCPPPIQGCHEEPIQGFCCPRYECPVSMATSLNVTTTTTTTTTTLPPHFLPHAYKGAAQRKGCQIKGHTYKVGEVVRASSGPCLHCTCGGDGQMKCDPKACTPEPMLRQMIAAAVSAKRRR